MAFVTIDDHTLEVVRVPGDGAQTTTLVFLHEGLGCAATWRDFPQSLAETTGCPALIYSRLGYGASDPAALPRPVSFMHEEALRTLPALLEKEGIDDAILVGHSDGASIALIYTGAVGNRVRGLVLEAPHVFVEEICIEAITSLRAFYPGSEMREKLARRHADADTTFHGWTDVWLRPDFRGWNIEEHLPGVRVPALVIQGENDEYGTPAQVEAVCAKVSAPTQRFFLPDVGHSPHRDRPEEVLDTMARFIRGLRGGP